MSRLILIILLLGLVACKENERSNKSEHPYSDDLSFLREHDKSLLELSSPDGSSRLILSPKYQGRVMTSTARGLEGTSHGWVNYNLIASDKMTPQFNPVGGEERLWLGPEGGQFSLYFAPGASFMIENWQVPPIIDTVGYAVRSSSDSSATFETRGNLVNYSGSKFDFGIARTVDLLRREAVEAELGIGIPADISCIGYRTSNTLTNLGSTQWTRETGLISIWLLGMFTPSERTTVIIPLPPGTDLSSISSDYFGQIPANRLMIRDNVLLFRCDGKYRSKIGLRPGFTNIAGSYDSERQVLTVTRFEANPDAAYVNSKWEIQDEPFNGDALNAYNDGPLADGSQLGPFYELESSSPAFPLQPNETQYHLQVTCHFEGDFDQLNSIAQQLLFVDLNTLKNFK